jgi:dTDP-4-amino-4,6-dideoxygalactose transaminase
MMDGRSVPVFQFQDDPSLEDALRDAAARVIARRQYVLSTEVDGFEHEFARFCGTSSSIGVANGTDALELALRAVGVVATDRIATVANAGFYTCTALKAIGAVPVFVDVDETLTMSPTSLANAMSEVKAVVVTHLYGRLAAIESIVALANQYHVPVIEDCAQAHGAARNGKRAGSFGAAGCFSFYPTKNLGALGDGGAVVTSDTDLAARVRALREYGWSSKYVVAQSGGRNSRLDELQAAFLRVQMPRVADRNAARTAIARRYWQGLRGLDILLPEPQTDEYVAHLFVIRVRARDAFRAKLAGARIGTAVHYPVPDHRQPICSAAPPLALPMTEAACRDVVTLPCYPGLSAEQVERVIAAVRDYFDAGQGSRAVQPILE